MPEVKPERWRWTRRVRLVFLTVAPLLTAACGYHVAGRATGLPKTWRTIAVPALVNRTTRYRIEQRLTDALIRELLARTPYRVVQDPHTADGVLTGEVKSIETSPVLFDATTGRVTTMLVTVHAAIRLADRTSGRDIYRNDDLVFREEYQISPDVTSFFEEQDPALNRLARDFAAQVVASLLESF